MSTPMALIPKWPSMRQMLTSMSEQLGYLTLTPYFSDRTGDQIGRLDVNAKMVAYWREASRAGEGAEDAPERFRRIKAHLQGAPEEEADEAEEAEEDVEEDVGAAPGTEEEIIPEALVDAVGAWVLSTCENNTPPGELQRFRLRLYQPKGSQLWSTIFDYTSQKQAPLPKAPPPPVPPGTGEGTAADFSDDLDPDEDDAFDGDDFFALGDDEMQMTELMGNMSDDFTDLDFPDVEDARDVDPSLTTPLGSRDVREGVKEIEGQINYLTRRETNARSGTPGSVVETGVQTLLHMHAAERAWTSHVLKTAMELQEMQADMLRQTNEMLSDARTQQAEMVDVIGGLRMNEMDRAAEAAQSQDHEHVRATLGKSAIEQFGLLGRVLLNNNARKALAQTQEAPAPPAIAAPPNGASTNGAPTNGAPTNGAPPSREYAAPPTPTPEAPEGEAVSAFDQIPAEDADRLLAWLDSRPDVVQALATPAVQDYLRTSDNVQQVVGLAEMMQEASTALEDPAADPANTLLPEDPAAFPPTE